MDLGHRPVSRTRPGERLMARRLWADEAVSSFQPSSLGACKQTLCTSGQTHYRRYYVRVAKVLGGPARSCHYRRTFR